MIQNYNCEKAYIPVDSFEYLSELELAEESLESVEILYKAQKFLDAYILLYKALQNVGNAVLINRFKLRSKSKNCQLKYLFEKDIISKSDLDLISELNDKRNMCYYNNSGFELLSQGEFDELYEKINTIILKLKGELK